MKKFKLEKILAWIGNILSILSMLILILFVVSMTKIPEMKQEVTSELMATSNLTLQDAQTAYDMVVVYLQGLLIISVIFIIVALIGTLMLNKSKASGIILIIVGILKLVLTFGTGIITSILWIIAGIKRVIYKEDNTHHLLKDEMTDLEDLKDPYEYR